MFDAIKQGAPSISIHVPLRGGRLIRICMFSAFLQFQSTSPYAGDDRTYTCGRNTRKISIHVPLRGGRRKCNAVKIVIDKFQSTSPYAGDDAFPKATNGTRCYFNPRPPTRGTTTKMLAEVSADHISIHVPLRGGRHDDDNNA